MAWLLSMPPCSVQSHSQAPAASHPDTCSLTLLVDSPSSAVLLIFFACHPACAISLYLQPSLGFTLLWISTSSLALKFSCSICHLTHHLSLTAETFCHPITTHSFPCYILARSAFTLSSLLDLILGRTASKSHKSDPEFFPQYSYICRSFCLHDVWPSSVSLYSLVGLSPCIISYLTLRLEVFVGKETYLHPASAESPEQ